VIKAVTKEKYIDLGFKILQEGSGTLILKHRSEGDELFFTLEKTITVRDL
jgi:hypothetical protein